VLDEAFRVKCMSVCTGLRIKELVLSLSVRKHIRALDLQTVALLFEGVIES